MKQLEFLLKTGVYDEYTPNKAIRIRDLIEELNLTNDQIFTVLVNGKKVDMNAVVSEKDKVSIIPQIAGGSKNPFLGNEISRLVLIGGLFVDMILCLILVIYLSIRNYNRYHRNKKEERK